MNDPTYTINTTNTKMEQVLSVLERLETRLTALETRLQRMENVINTQHVQSQDAIRDALATTVALTTWVERSGKDNPPPEAGVLRDAAAELKDTRAAAFLGPTVKTKAPTLAIHFATCWAASEEFRTEYVAAKAAKPPARTAKDTDQTFLIKEGKAAYKNIGALPELKARFATVYASHVDMLK